MTIKEAFEALSSACAKGMKNPFFVMKRLKESFADVADKVVDAGGSEVNVSTVFTGGVELATITVDDTPHTIYTPFVIAPYSEEEHKVGVWYHDNISEDVYERTFSLDNISTTESSPDELISASYVLIDVKATGIYTVSNVPYVFDDLVFVNSINTDSFNLRLSLQKGSDYYTIYKTGTGTVSNGVLTLRYVKRTT